MSAPPQLPPAGWYADPVAGPGTLRWWAGGAWTDHVTAAPVPAPDPAAQDPAATDPAARENAAPSPALPARAAWWALFGIAVGEILGGLLAAVATAFTHSATGSVAILFGEVGLWTGMIGGCVMASRRFGTGSLRRDLSLGIRPADLGWGPLAFLAGVILSVVVGALFAGSQLRGSNTSIISDQKSNGAGFILVTVIVALGAPIVEELFFRGLVRTALAARLGDWGAIVAQAVLFGLAHFQVGQGLGNVSVMVTVGALGLVLGITARLTRRLGAGMIGHSLFNLLAVITILSG